LIFLFFGVWTLTFMICICAPAMPEKSCALGCPG
jgi:hypothetical protein